MFARLAKHSKTVALIRMNSSLTRIKSIFIPTVTLVSAYTGYQYYNIYLKQASVTNDSKSTKELLKQHAQIWDLMNLSKNAKNELQQTVENVNNSIQTNYKNDQSFMKQFKEPNRTNKNGLTQKNFLDNHMKRFNMLGLTNDTKNELISAANWTWNVLYDKDSHSSISKEDIKRAEILKQMMNELNGPPPCCDDNIFIKAKNRD